MKRREFLKSAGLGVVGTTALAAPAIAQSAPEIRWRMTSSFPRSLDAIFGAGEMFAKTVAELTDNKFTIQPFAAGEIAPAFQAVDEVQKGAIECAHTASYYYVGKDPTFAFGTAVPFGLNTRQQSAWMYQGGGEALMNEFYSQYNIVGFPGGNTGAQMGGWFRKEINTLADLAGLKMRISGFAGQVLQKLGAVPQQIPGGEVYQALEKGTIDAAEWVGPYDDEKLGFQQVAKYYYYPGWWEGSALLNFFVNKEKWNALPKTYQVALRAAAAQADVNMVAKYDTNNAGALKRLVSKGAVLKPFSRDVLEAAYKATFEIYAETAASNPAFKKIYDSWKPFRDDQYLWFRVVENTFENFVYSQQGK